VQPAPTAQRSARRIANLARLEHTRTIKVRLIVTIVPLVPTVAAVKLRAQGVPPVPISPTLGNLVAAPCPQHLLLSADIGSLPRGNAVIVPPWLGKKL